VSTAEQSTSADLGAGVENIRYSDDMSSVIATVQNTSQKIITAINLSIEVVCKDGHRSNSEQLQDVLAAMISRRRESGAAVLSAGGIAPGSTLDFTIFLEKDALAVHANVNAVTYLDLSGEGNSDGLKRIAKNRQEYAEGLSEGVAIISNALTSAGVTDARAMARHQLNEALANLKSSKNGIGGMKEMAYKPMLDDLDRPLSDADLELYVLHRSDEAAYQFKHSKINTWEYP
jgi:hypothetical protein